MDILTIFKVIALAVFTLAAVFVILAAATMWRTERAAAGRINRLISADPAEASGDKERADNALLDVTEITRRVSEDEEPEEAEAEAEAEAEDVPAEIARLKEEVSFLNECREADSRRIQNLEERLADCDESCDDCDVEDGMESVSLVAEVPDYVAYTWCEDMALLKQALEDAVRNTDANMWLADINHVGVSSNSLSETLGKIACIPVGDSMPKRPSPSSKYPSFETKPSSKSWQYRGGRDLDRRMDALRETDNHAVWIARFRVNRVRKMDTIPERIMEGVREAVEEAEKSAEKGN